MMFDRLCAWAERDARWLMKSLKEAALFQITDEQCDSIGGWDRGTVREIAEGFFTPFDSIVLEDSTSAVLLLRGHNARGLYQDMDFNALAIGDGSAWSNPGGLNSTSIGKAMLCVEARSLGTHLRLGKPGDEKEVRQLKETMRANGISESDTLIDAFLVVGLAEAPPGTPNPSRPGTDATCVIALHPIGYTIFSKRKGSAPFREYDHKSNESAKSISDTALTVVRQMWWANQPSNWIAKRLDEVARPVPKGKIARSDQRERYIVLTKEAIERCVRTPNPENAGTPLHLGHRRRAHWATLRHERYRFRRGQRVFVKACWVGPEEIEYGHEKYRVLTELEAYAPM